MEARSLASVLRRFPISIETIRGIDVATDELGVPTWVIALLFRHVRKAGIAASETLRRRADILVPPLRATAHAGEDFIHLMTGLRHVDEAITRLELREGDRIGHGVALGVDPYAWCHPAGRIAVAREERLFDLVWELSWYGRGDLESPGGRVHRIERQVARLSKTIFGLTISLFDMELLTELIECLYSEPGVKVDAPPVSICIGSDNPLTFVTNLPEEYQLLLDALVLAGCSGEQARQWLNRVRETGLENRFTVPRSGLAITSMMNP